MSPILKELALQYRIFNLNLNIFVCTHFVFYWTLYSSNSCFRCITRNIKYLVKMKQFNYSCILFLVSVKIWLAYLVRLNFLFFRCFVLEAIIVLHSLMSHPKNRQLKKTSNITYIRIFWLSFIILTL